MNKGSLLFILLLLLCSCQFIHASNPEIRRDRLENLSDKERLAIKIISTTILIVIGAIFVMLGYRLVRVVFTIAIFLAVYFVTTVLLQRFAHSLQWWHISLISLGTGAIGAIISSFFFCLGCFLVGFISGCLISQYILITPIGVDYMKQPWARDIIIVVVGIIFGVLTVIFKRVLIIIATSHLGAWLIASSIDISAFDGKVISRISFIMTGEHLFKDLTPPGSTINRGDDWKVYLLVGIVVMITIVGVVTQLFVTKKRSV